MDHPIILESKKYNKRYYNNNIKKPTAFEWLTYLNRSDSLKLLRSKRIHVDTLLTTHDNSYSTSVHWQVFSALCPRLIEASKVIDFYQDDDKTKQNKTCEHKRVLELPKEVDSYVASYLVKCAYGEQLLDLLDNKLNLFNFYKISQNYDINYGIKISLNYFSKSLLDANNCIRFFLLSLKHRHHKLRRESYSLIKTNFKLILHINHDFHLLPLKYFRRLLLDDYLKIDDDEEFAWLAIKRWLNGNSMLTPIEYMNTYNEMVKQIASKQQQRQSDQEWLEQQLSRIGRYTIREINRQNLTTTNHLLTTTTAINFYNQLIPFENVSNPKNFILDNRKQDLFDDLLDLKSLAPFHRNFNDISENELYELILCLRFMLFKSVNAFNVILSCDFVLKSKKISLLVNLMKFRYIVKHKLPLDLSDIELTSTDPILTQECLNLLKKSNNKTKRLTSSSGLLNRLLNVLKKSNARQDEEEMGTNIDRKQAYKDHDNDQRDDKDGDDDDILNLTNEIVNNQSDFCPINRAEKPRIPNSVALLMGGWQEGTVSDSILAYDFVCDKWFKLKIRLPGPRAFLATCYLNGSIYVFGGTDGEEILNSMYRFNPTTDIKQNKFNNNTFDNKQKISNKKQNLTKVYSRRKMFKNWLVKGGRNKSGTLLYKFHKLKSMNERRCHLSGVLHSDGKIYALGGHNGRERLRSCERFDLKSNQWHSIADMSIARSNASACSHDNKIFIAGGQIGNLFIQSSVEFYKANDNTWTFLSPMVVPRMSFNLISYKNYLFAIGGTNGLIGGNEVGSVTKSVERYIPTTLSWSLCSTMLERRCSFGIMQIGDKLIVVGGYNGRHRLKNCETLKIGHYTISNHQTIANGLYENLLSNNNINSNLQNRTNIHNSNNNNFNRIASIGLERLPDGQRQQQQQSMLRTVLKWFPTKSNLPAKRSGFSIAIIKNFKNAKDFTYHGSLKKSANKFNNNNNNNNLRRRKRASVIKKKSKWNKFKIMKRRKFINHLKIALVLTVVILLI